MARLGQGSRDCTVPYFGFKAKPKRLSCTIARQLYCALFWIQGKTVCGVVINGFKLYCALFWIQGKTCTRAHVTSTQLYCALFWIQGKTQKTS